MHACIRLHHNSDFCRPGCLSARVLLLTGCCYSCCCCWLASTACWLASAADNQQHPAAASRIYTVLSHMCFQIVIISVIVSSNPFCSLFSDLILHWVCSSYSVGHMYSLASSCMFIFIFQLCYLNKCLLTAQLLGVKFTIMITKDYSNHLLQDIHPVQSINTTHAQTSSSWCNITRFTNQRLFSNYIITANKIRD